LTGRRLADAAAGPLGAWLTAGVGELLLARETAEPPLALQAAAELALCALVGGLQARFAPSGWLASPAWAPVALIAGAALRAPELHGPTFALAVLGALLFGVMAVRVGDDLLTRLPRGAGLLLALGGAGVARAVVLFTNPVAEPHRRLGEDLLSPLTRLRPAPAGADAPPIVVLTVDTLRSDEAVRMKSWARLQQGGATWERAMATASWTVPSLASLWTGLTPAEHGAALIPAGGFSPMAEGAPLLAEELGRAGYATAAFVANPFIASGLGFRRGFSTWSNPDEDLRQPLLWMGRRPGPHSQDGARVVDRALGWLDAAPDRGFLLWVHLFDCHLPYAHLPDGDPALALHSPQDVRESRVEVTPALKEAVRAAYRREVAYEDAQIGRVLDALEARRFFEQGGVLLFTADHGEELWDHGGFEHGHSHHGEVLDVPLALRAPGLTPGPRETEASLVDVAATLRAAAGLPAGGGAGQDLRGPLAADRVLSASGNLYGPQQTSARSRERRAIATWDAPAGPRVELYDRAADPGARSPLPHAGTRSREAETALSTPLANATGDAAALNEAALRALGYIQ
jgi:arylsulfatase A-like enzyme